MRIAATLDTTCSTVDSIEVRQTDTASTIYNQAAGAGDGGGGVVGFGAVGARDGGGGVVRFGAVGGNWVRKGTRNKSNIWIAGTLACNVVAAPIFSTARVAAAGCGEME